jgi:hypothetical protein
MGLSRDLKNMVDEYKRDPSGQYWRNLDKMLNLYQTGKLTKQQVLDHVKEWASK